MAIATGPEATSGGNLTFLLLMIGLTLVAAAVAVLHPLAWTAEEVWIAVAGPVAAGAILGLVSAIPMAAVTIYGQTAFGSQSSLWWSIATVAAAGLAAGVGGFMLLRKSAFAAVLWALAFGIAAHAGLNGTASLMRPLLISPELVATLEAAELMPAPGGAAGPVAITRFHEPSFVFLTATDTEQTDAAGAARAVAAGRPAFVESVDDAAFHASLAEMGLAARSAGAVSGKNYSNGRDLTLTLYTLAEGTAAAAP